MASGFQILTIFMAECPVENRSSARMPKLNFYYLILTQSLPITIINTSTSQDPPTYTLYALSSTTYMDYNSTSQVFSKNIINTNSNKHNPLDLNTTTNITLKSNHKTLKG